MTQRIDLSQLPPPAFATAPELEAIVTATLARIRQLMGDDAPELDLDSDPAAMTVQANAWRETLLYAAVNDAARGTLLPWAEGGALEWIAANQGAGPRLAGESDDDYRQRIQAAARGVSVAGPQSSYEALARAASALAAEVAAAAPAAGSVTVDVLVAAGAEELALDSLPLAKGQLARALLEAGEPPNLYQAGIDGDLLSGSLSLGAGLSASRLRYDAGNELAPEHADYRAPEAAIESAEDGLGAWAAAGGAGSAKVAYFHDESSGIALQVSAATRATRSLTWSGLGAAERAWLSALAEGERFLLIVADANPAAPAQPAVEFALSARAARALHAVRAALNAENARPMGDIVTVREAARAAYSVSATIAVADGPDPAAVLAAVTADVQSYVDSARRIGGAVKLGAIYAALYGPGVTDAQILSPAADIASVARTAPECSQVTVTLQ